MHLPQHCTVENEVPERPGKRAPRCKELDDPLIRKEIEFRYGTLCWKLEAVAEDINKAYNLNATKYQYRQRLMKWGCRQRLNHQEYQRVHETICVRKTFNKKSKVFLNGTTEIPEQRLRRWENRNITFTERLFLKAGNFRTSPEMQGKQETTGTLARYGSIRTPSPNPETYMLPIVKRSVSAHYPHTPIGQVLGYLERNLSKHLWHPATESSTAIMQNASPHLPLLATIIYRISNQLVGPYHLDSFLDQVDTHGLRKNFQNLLSHDYPSILATCSALLAILYFRQDNEMFRFICDRHSQLVQRPYYYLCKLLDHMSHNPKNPRWVILDHIISDISNANLAPETVQEAEDLLYACKRNPQNFSIFCRLWDPAKVSVQELDNYGSSRNSQLKDCDVTQLKWLLGCGFTRGRRLLLLKAIIFNNHALMQTFCESLGLTLLEPAAGLATINQDMEAGDTWELLDKPTFYDLIAKCAIEVYGERYESLPRKRSDEVSELSQPELSQPELSQPEFYLLVEAACLQPRFTKYAVEIIQWKLSISAEQAALVAIDTAHTIGGAQRLAESLSPSRFRMFGPGRIRPKSRDRLCVLKTLLSFGVNPNETSFWRAFLWDEASMILNSSISDHPGKRRLYQIFRVFIASGANLHGSLDPIVSRTAGYYRVYENMEYFDFRELDKPVEVAFRFKDSGLFRLLMRRSACVLRLCSHLTSGKYHGVNLELIQAIQDRNQDVIKELWDQRTLNMAVTSALEKGKIDTARDIIVNKSEELRLTPLFLEVAESYSYHRLPAADCYEILGLILGLGAKFDIDPQVSYKKCECQNFTTLQERRESKYKMLLHDASRIKDVTFFKLLMAFYPFRADSLDSHDENSPRYHQFQENRIFQLGWAANSSLEILKFLISQGFHIEEPAMECDKYCGHAFSAIYGAIMKGDIEILAYVLSEGANVYAPCGESSSAVEAAISQGRIDSLALILEAVPNAYPLALAIVEDPEYLKQYRSSKYILEYVRAWRPADIGTDMGGSIVDVTGENLVLWRPISNL